MWWFGVGLHAWSVILDQNRPPVSRVRPANGPARVLGGYRCSVRSGRLAERIGGGPAAGRPRAAPEPRQNPRAYLRRALRPGPANAAFRVLAATGPTKGLPSNAGLDQHGACRSSFPRSRARHGGGLTGCPRGPGRAARAVAENFVDGWVDDQRDARPPAPSTGLEGHAPRPWTPTLPMDAKSAPTGS